MHSTLETLSIAAASIVLFILVSVIFFNLYLIKRNGFYVNANCWFCNAWTKVLYANRNSFDCPSCLQYNGFDEDGDYNKVIEAQHKTSFKKHKTTEKTELYSNGLCTYCNNNQQLKVYQLAKFTPINEETYDIEVEHFQKQLEKAYRLCKKCEKVLKSTINKKHAWIFGNRLKNLRKEGLSLIDLTKSSHGISRDIKQSFCLRVIRFTLIAFTVLVLCQILNVKIEYPLNNMKNSIPKAFIQYEIIMKDFYSTIFNVSKRFDEEIHHLNSYLPKSVKIHSSNLLPITSVGFLLEFILLIWEEKSILWKINGILGWALLLLSSSVSVHHSFFFYINISQVFASLALLYRYISYEPAKIRRKNTGGKFQFRKIKKTVETIETSEDEMDEFPNTSESSAASRKSPESRKSYKTSRSFHCQSHSSSSPIPQFGNLIRNTANVDHSFTTAKSPTTTSFFDDSANTINSCSLHTDLNRSLDNLHLNNIDFRPQPCASPVFSVSSMNRPILSPPKLKNITQNPWTAGGFWKNEVNVLPVAVDHTNLSRSSSQSSGFVSSNEPIMNHFNSSPASREPSISGDIDKTSVLSEPAYHFTPINSNVSQSSNHQQLYYKADNNTFYPVLNQNNMLFIQSSVPQHNFQSSLGNASLRSFNTRMSGINSPSLFSEKPTSSLFKGLHSEDFFKKPSI